MDKRYFFWFAVAFLCGILLSAKHILLCIFVAAVLLLVALFVRKYGKTKLFMGLAIGTLIGGLCFFWQFTSYTQTLDNVKDKTVTVEGRVEEVREGDKLRLLVRGAIRGEGVFIEDTAVYVYPEGDAYFSYGDMVSFSGKASVPRKARNFGESDYRIYCMGKGVSAFFYPKADEMEMRGNSFSLLRPKDAAHALRTMTQHAISGRLSFEAEGFLRAYLTGDEALMHADSHESLRISGLSHIVAVSGMHLTVIVGAFMLLFGIFKIRKRLFSVACYIVFTWFFVLFTGAGTSVLRAALMLTVFFLADFFRRDNDSLTALAFAAFSMCAVSPGVLFDVGFQLSCASTLTILLFGEPFRHLFRALPRFFREQFAMFLSASIGFTPLMALWFGSVCTVGILANLLVSPLLSPVLVAGFIGVFVHSVPVLSDVIFWLLDKGISYILFVADGCAALPFASLSLQRPGLLSLVGYVLLAAALFLFLERNRRRLLLICLLALSLLTADAAAVLFQRNITTVTFLSVGNGDCALVTGKSGTLLIDSGGSAYTDVAENTVIPYLQRQGISRIDAAFLTHYHIDHGGAMLALLEKGMVGILYLPYHEDKDLKTELARAAYRAGTPIRYLGGGDVVTMGDYQVASFDARAGSDENNGLVYRLETAGTRLLFTGDIDENAERRLLYTGADLACDVLKVPHHGAATSTLPEFIDAAAPELAVISCGENSYGHPHDYTLAQYEEKDIPVCRTDKNGTVRLYLFSGGRKWIQTLYKNT